MGRYVENPIPNVDNSQFSSTRLLPALGAVMHTTGGTNSIGVLSSLGTVGPSSKSANVLIDRDGTRHVIVSAGRCAWHTGVTWWPGARPGRMDPANEVFLGVELECLDDQRPTWQQYDSAAEYLVENAVQLGWRWPYVLYGHYALATPLGRREDPVRFDWGAFIGFLYAASKQSNIGGL